MTDWPMPDLGHRAWEAFLALGQGLLGDKFQAREKVLRPMMEADAIMRQKAALGFQALLGGFDGLGTGRPNYDLFVRELWSVLRADFYSLFEKDEGAYRQIAGPPRPPNVWAESLAPLWTGSFKGAGPSRPDILQVCRLLGVTPTKAGLRHFLDGDAPRKAKRRERKVV